MAIIAHYKLNDNAATTTVLDETGNHNGTIKDAGGTATTAAHTAANSRGVGTCLDFDGTDDYIEVADHADFTPALTPFSISAWVYMHDATRFKIASKGSWTVDGEWGFETDGSDKLEFICYDETAVAQITRSTSGALTSYENQWIHLVATYDGGILPASIKIYLNATRIDDTDGTLGTFVSIRNAAADVYIGRYSVTYADGLIDNVIIFNTELNIDQVKALYNGGHGTEIVADIDIDRRIRRR